MTTKFLDNNICTFKILLSWRFPRKTAFFDNSPLDPHVQPLKSANFIFIVVSQSMNSGCLQCWKRSFADSRLRSFALVCALLRSFACFRVRLHLERPRLGTADQSQI